MVWVGRAHPAGEGPWGQWEGVRQAFCEGSPQDRLDDQGVIHPGSSQSCEVIRRQVCRLDAGLAACLFAALRANFVKLQDLLQKKLFFLLQSRRKYWADMEDGEETKTEVKVDDTTTILE